MRKSKSTDNLTRKPISNIALAISAQGLIDSKRISRKSRQVLLRGRGDIIDAPRAEPKSEQEVVLRKLSALSLAKLGQQLTRTKRKLRQAERILATISCDSRFRPAMERELSRLKYVLSWIEDEIKAR